MAVSGIEIGCRTLKGAIRKFNRLSLLLEKVEKNFNINMIKAPTQN